MKVKEIIKKLKMSSNASVIIQEVKAGSLVELTCEQTKDVEPQYAMNMKVNSFDIVDNVLTIYAE